MKNRANTFILITAMLLGQGTLAHGASRSIVDSKHNLSASGTGELKASTESEVCIFCHTPHSGRSDITYLWNRSAQATTYTPYASTTMSVVVGQPNRASKLCLSCHDGTIALGATLTRTIPFIGADTLSGRSTSLGTDLRDDHPVSFYYADSTLINDELVDPIAPGSPVKLDSTGQLQCTACHDPHNDFNGNFLVMANDQSALCATCHDKTGWSLSSHATSNAIIGTTTVAQNACGNCHQPHNAGSSQRLLKHAVEEDNCLSCHDGSVAGKDRAFELERPYKHPVSSYSGIHNPAEEYSGLVTKHVECEDCHNPHQAKKTTTEVAPYVPGPLKGVRGVDFYTNADLNPAIYEYEICFKCHGDLSNNMMTTPQPIPRYWTNTRDNRVKFDPANLSYHPVMAPLNKISDNLLNAPWEKGSILYCTDCHGNDTGDPKGPHGSDTPHILIDRYETSADPRPGVGYNYLTENALCFRCHKSTTLMGAGSKFPQHNKHLTDKSMERCSYCHDPHGNPTNPGMINFDMRVVSESSGKPIILTYPLGSKNSCRLTCHGVQHGN